VTIRLIFIGLLICSSSGFAQTLDPCAIAPQTCATLIETHAISQMWLPNTAVDVAIEVNASGKDLQEVQRTLAEQSSKLLAYLKTQKVERLITVEVSFAPDTRSQKSGPAKTVGYDGSANVSFRAKPERLADLLAGVLANGADTIESTTFTPTEEEIAEARRHLSEDATKSAIGQAEEIARAAGMKLIAVRNINVDSNNLQGRLRSTATYANADDSGGLRDKDTLAPIQAESGDKQLSVSVNVTAAATAQTQPPR
jgi:uncharacterized protein YggE